MGFPMKYLKTAILTLFISSTSILVAQEPIWTGKAGDGLWSTAANWSDDTLPASGNFVTIADAGEVNFAGLNGNQYLPKKISLNLQGKTIFSNDSELLRLDATELNVFPGASVAAGHLVFYAAQCTFHDGAIIQVKAWEQNGANVFKFVLGKTGFTEISAGGFWVGDISEATYIADLSAYTGGESVIPLLGFKSLNSGLLTEEDFKKASLEVQNPGNFKGSRIQWNANEKTIELVVAK